MLTVYVVNIPQLILSYMLIAIHEALGSVDVDCVWVTTL